MDHDNPMAKRLISAIIPARNEEKLISQSVDRLRRSLVHEVIVADGGSSDLTVSTARAHGAKVVHSPPGRGIQMNCGAQAAAGDVLLFVHADTALPQDLDRYIQTALAQRHTVAGAFRLRIDDGRRAFRVIERYANWRSRWRQMPYGDQAIFLSSNMFIDIGRYRDMAAMEDLDLVRRLRRAGRIVTVAADAMTSARRWQRDGIWRTTMINQVCILGYRLGICPTRIAAWRNGSVPGGLAHIPPPPGAIAGR